MELPDYCAVGAPRNCSTIQGVCPKKPQKNHPNCRTTHFFRPLVLRRQVPNVDPIAIGSKIGRRRRLR